MDVIALVTVTVSILLFLICLTQLELLTLIQFLVACSFLVFEKAYCEYRLYKNQEALMTLTSAPKLDWKCKELLAQLVSLSSLTASSLDLSHFTRTCYFL